MIGLSRLKRAIGDVPTSGMQTGDPKVRLKLCDAQRLEVEYGALIAERDAALANNAELVAQVAQLELNTESLMSIIKSKAAAHINMNVAEIQGEALLAAASYLSESISDKSHESVIFKDGYVYISTRYLREYAERVKAGEA